MLCFLLFFFQVNSRGINLDVGEDRVILEGPGRMGKEPYKLDIFIPYSVDQEKCSANFNTDTKVRIPLSVITILKNFNIKGKPGKVK